MASGSTAVEELKEALSLNSLKKVFTLEMSETRTGGSNTGTKKRRFALWTCPWLTFDFGRKFMIKCY